MKPILIIQNCAAESPGTIIDYLNDKALAYQIIHSYKNHDFPTLDTVSAVINLGCPISAISYQEHEFLKKLYAYVSEIVRTDKPYLGICFGGQILAKVLGAQVEQNPKKEIGTYSVTLTDDGLNDPIFNNFDKKFSVFHWHGDTFKIPFDATLLATGRDCKNQAFRKKNAVGIQFHLETNINEIPKWCDEYSDELKEVGKTKEEIITDYKSIYKKIKSNNYLFLDNFLTQI